MQHLILITTLLFSTLIFSQTSENANLNEQNNITVSVVNALTDEGTVNFALFNEENFRQEPLVAESSIIKNGVSTVVFKNVPVGAYAIICYHDENNNKRLDFQNNGMPKENYGTSNNSLSFGPPQFERSMFELKGEDVTLEIKF
ncbi:DUF2141 domain-containing protein [Lutibacter sp. A80]|uniref:DUF2141 domain-containing protein n=1 Tax=Lutibacter sp. A80 TaxID=2918453 RepID=UPI001F05957A|nr:DUF2141 domain-containing protein [Lutibacter sp. A80]UMB60734.1 DUF2141 domain-containing protein [Lutibacter sp. A80]